MERDLAVYENAISSSYWTMPSIASLFTGMYTSGHGLVVDGDKINGLLLTLPVLLRQHGYRCAGFVRNVYVSEYSGLDSVFDDFYSKYGLDTLKKVVSIISKKGVSRLHPPGITRPFDDSPNDESSIKEHFFNVVARCFDILTDRGGSNFVYRFARWLEEYKTKPFFAFFQFLETHPPYRAPLRFALKFSSIQDNIKRFFINHDHLKFLLSKCQMTSKDFQILQSAYDNSIHYADYLIGKIVLSLQKHSVFDNTLIIVLADHGDNIGDHGLMFHYFCLYDTLIKIPLVVKFPANVGVTGRISKVVQNVDIFPTILSLLDVQDKKAWEQIQGNDLLGQVPPKREQDLAISELVKVFGPDRSHYKEQLNQFNRRLLSVRTRDRKFIYSSRGDHECYDLAKDPAELNNLYPEDNRFSDLMEKAFKYYSRMDDFYMANRENIDGDINFGQIDESIIEQLKSLGYM
jgi:arylsulfatase A-like enzyme